MNPLSGVFGEAWRMYRAHAGHLIGIAFVIYIAAAVLDGLISLAGGFITALLGLIISVLAGYLVQAALVKSVQDIRDGRADLSISETVSAGTAVLLPVTWPAVKTPLGPSSMRIITPELAAVPPVSALMMWAVLSAITSSPRRQCTRIAAWLHIVPLGMKTASSLPSSSHTFSRRRSTVGSSYFCSSPTSASAMAFRMPGEGFVLVSL
jgi:hypothetical protein